MSTKLLQTLRFALAASAMELPLRRLHHALAGGQASGYDIQTLQVMRHVLPRHGNAVDVGCHSGHILAAILRWAPGGRHLGIEPLPLLQPLLQQRFGRRPQVTLLPVALGDVDAEASFVHVVNNPAYSGLRQRRYDRAEVTRCIQVPVRRLDGCIPAGQPVHFVKIDVEGGELQVLRGAQGMLRRWQPVVVFEHGLGAADCYGSTPQQVHAVLASCGLQVMRMADWLAGRGAPLSVSHFADLFSAASDYYFMAAPASLSPPRVGRPGRPSF